MVDVAGRSLRFGSAGVFIPFVFVVWFSSSDAGDLIGGCLHIIDSGSDAFFSFWCREISNAVCVFKISVVRKEFSAVCVFVIIFGMVYFTSLSASELVGDTEMVDELCGRSLRLIVFVVCMFSFGASELVGGFLNFIDSGAFFSFCSREFSGVGVFVIIFGVVHFSSLNAIELDGGTGVFFSSLGVGDLYENFCILLLNGVK